MPMSLDTLWPTIVGTLLFVAFARAIVGAVVGAVAQRLPWGKILIVVGLLVFFGILPLAVVGDFVVYLAVAVYHGTLALAGRMFGVA